MKHNALNDSMLRAIDTHAGKGQLTDGDGLYLKLPRYAWRFDYKSPTTKKRNALTFGLLRSA